jgi:hypothetical protein
VRIRCSGYYNDHQHLSCRTVVATCCCAYLLLLKLPMTCCLGGNHDVTTNRKRCQWQAPSCDQAPNWLLHPCNYSQHTAPCGCSP